MNNLFTKKISFAERFKRHYRLRLHMSLILRAPHFLIFLCLWLVAVLPVFWSCPAAANHDHPQIVILNSNHYGSAWSDNELAGLLARLRQDYPEIAPFIEYLDAKRLPGPDQLERMRDYLAGKYRGKKIDLVIALDNPALELATQYRQEVFPGVPLVFAGINNFTPAMLRGRKKVTGVAEVEDLAGTLELALTLHPHTREVVMIHDYTASGLALRREMEAAAPQFQDRVKIRFLPPSTFQEFVGQLQSLPANSLGLITAFATDREGQVLSSAASTRLCAASIDFPMYGTHDSRLGQGIVGGSLLSGADHGKRAGEMALKVLAGEDPDRLPVDTAGAHRLMFDYRQLTRFGIPLEALPAESVVINRPVSFYEQYKYLTLAASWVFAFLLLAVGVLAVAIVRRQRAERRLRNSEARHRSLVETSFDWIWEVDAQVRYTYASPRVIDFLGYTPEEMLGRTPFEFMPEAEARRIGEIFAVIAAARRPFTSLENVNLHRDGRRVVLETSGAPMFGPDGEFKGYRGSDRDITARQAAEQALLQSEERLRLANEAANIGTLDVDLETGWVRLSPELCAILGVPPGTKWHGYEGIKIVHPDDRDLVMAISLRSQDPAGDGRIYSEHRIIRPDGEVRWVMWDGRTIFRDTSADPVPFRGIAAVFDITERKRAEEDLRKSEERYRLLVSQIPAMVFQGYGDWSIDPFDEKVEALTGYSKEDFESRRVKWYDLIPAEDLDYATRVFIEALKTDKSYVREHRLRKKDGEIIWVQCRGQIFCNDQGKVDYISGVSFDVTERRRAQEALKERERFLADIFDSIQDGICILDTDFNIVSVNQAMELWFPHALPLAGNKCYAAYRQRSAPCEVCPSRETLETGKAGHAVMTKIGPDGEAAGWLEVYTFPMLEISSGKVRGIIQYLRDITKRKQAEEALQLSEEKYRLLVKQIPAIVFKGYADWSVDFFDNKVETLTGYSKEEFDSRQIKWCELILPEDLEQAKSRLINGIKAGGAYGREYRLRKKDGGIAWIQVMGQIFCDAEGKLDYVSGVFFDITERKRAEEDLRQSEARLAEAQRIAQVGSWEWNVKTNQAVWSEELFHIFHLPPQEHGLSYEEFFQYVHPDDRESLKQSIAEIRAFAKDYRIILGDGSQRDVHIDAEIIWDESGEPALMRGTAQDITGRVLAEQKLREVNERFAAVFENAAMGISVADAQGRILATNPSFQEMLGYDTGELLDKTFPEITHPKDLPQNLELFQEMMTGKSEGFQIEKRYLRKNGKYFWARVTVSPIKETKGQPPYSIAVVEDITQRKQAQEKLRESERNLRSLASQLLTAQERERRRISSELHDELGHALLTLKLNLRSIERELYPDQQALAEEIESIFYDLDEVIENVRRLYLDLVPGDIEDLGLTTALQMLIDEYARNNQNIQWSVNLINIDNKFTLLGQTAIYRIFQEILTNVGKHADPSLVSVRIEENDKMVFFEVEDNGQGFSREDAHQYLQNGMGLLAMEERARMLGGSLEVWSQNNQGTRITFSIPISEGGKID